MNKDREHYILEKLLSKKKVTVKELAEELYASEPSIRRDLVSLEQQNLIKRIHGGAVLEETGISAMKIPFVLRELEQTDAKVIMAKKAISLVHDNDVIFLDASSSAYTLIPYLALKNNITVVTCGVKALSKLAEYNITTICTGGRMNNSCYALVGDRAYDTIDHINADIAFFSCRGLSSDGKLTDISAEENYVRKHMITNAKKSYLLCASKKFDKLYYHTLCTTEEVTGIVSEIPAASYFNNI